MYRTPASRRTLRSMCRRRRWSRPSAAGRDRRSGRNGGKDSVTGEGWHDGWQDGVRRERTGGRRETAGQPTGNVSRGPARRERHRCAGRAMRVVKSERGDSEETASSRSAEWSLSEDGRAVRRWRGCRAVKRRVHVKMRASQAGPAATPALPPDWRSHSEARLGSLPYKACHLCCAGTAVLAPAVVECAHARASPSEVCCMQPSYPRPIYPTHAPFARTPLPPTLPVSAPTCLASRAR